MPNAQFVTGGGGIMGEPNNTGDVTVFDKIGGEAAVRSMVDNFYKRVVADPSLAPYFSHVPLDRLRNMQFEFFSAALGGPVRYTGRPIAHIHQSLRITLADFQRFVQHLFETLAELPLTEHETYEIVSRLNLYTNDVVSAGTGIVG
ncbi:MAG: group 1 truncated hemoglobin [Nevskia sp.]|nr:group 1 truncated hemoglobin [Nevskia sp.]